MAKFAVSQKGVLGFFQESTQGVRFIPLVQHQPSRKHWPTVYAALPRWAKDARIIDATNAEAAVATYRDRIGRPL